MTNPTRSDLKRAAIAFFNDLASQVEWREGFDLDNLAAEIDFNLTESRRRIAELDTQLSANTFDGAVAAAADKVLRDAEFSEDVGGGGLSIIAKRLAARAEREQLEMLIHALTTPAKPYEHFDNLFSSTHGAPIGLPPPPAAIVVASGKLVTPSLLKQGHGGSAFLI